MEVMKVDQRYKELKRKSDRQGYVTEAEYLEIMSYERPEYHQKIMRAINDWEEMDEDEFEQILDELDQQDQELVYEHINPDH
jgi:hypothetical protein